MKNTYTLPNYPPVRWKTAPRKITYWPLRVVYVGALSLGTMHTENFAHWIVRQEGKVIWDIYSYNFTSDVKEFLSGLGTTFINLKPGVDYNQLPKILVEYSVGVILYNGHIPNFVYNAPNKLFEYLACGLDVWFPTEMIGSNDYVTVGTYPIVMKLDFTNLNQYDINALIDKGNLTLKQFDYHSENSLGSLVNKLLAK
jgi:hypothetical protein